MKWNKYLAFISAIILISLPACSPKATPTALATQVSTETLEAATSPAATMQPSQTPSVSELATTPTRERKTLMPGTGTPTAVMVIVSANTDCRSGPGPAYALLGQLKTGKIAIVVGMEGDSLYWLIKNPDGRGGTCWISGKNAKVRGMAYYTLPVVTAPPSPTPTPVPTLHTPAPGVVWNITLTIAYSMIHTPDCNTPGSFTQIGTVTITTNGAATVTFHLEDSVQGAFPDQTMVFPDAGTESDKLAYNVVTQPCVDHVWKVITTNPNSLAGSAGFQVVTP